MAAWSMLINASVRRLDL